MFKSLQKSVLSSLHLIMCAWCVEEKLRFKKKRERRNLTFQSQLRVSKFLTFITFWQIIYECSDNLTVSYLKVCLGSWLCSACQIMIIQHIEMKLRFGNIGKCKIWIMRVHWHFRNFWLSSNVWETFRLQKVSLDQSFSAHVES